MIYLFTIAKQRSNAYCTLLSMLNPTPNRILCVTGQHSYAWVSKLRLSFPIAILAFICIHLYACSESNPENTTTEKTTNPKHNVITSIITHTETSLPTTPNTDATGYSPDKGNTGQNRLPTIFSTNPADLINPATLNVETDQVQIQMAVGETKSFSYSLQIDNETGAEITAIVKELINQESGLYIHSENPRSIHANRSSQHTFNRTLTAYSPGKYQVQISAHIPSNGISDDEIIFVTVLSEDLQAKLLPLTILPNAIGINEIRDILCSIQVVGSEGLAVNSMELDIVDKTGSTIIRNLGAMKQQGKMYTDGSLLFTHSSGISSNESGKLYFQATADITSLGIVRSPVFSIHITPFPIGIIPSLSGHIITDPNNAQIVNNELLLSFTENTGSKEIMEIVQSVSGKVIGALPEANIYQIRIPGDGTYSGLSNIASALSDDQRISNIDPNIVSNSNDSPFTNSQHLSPL